MRTRDENKEKLVKEKAIELLVKDGFDGFSMQKLAKISKVSPATLYIYYKDKDDLIRKIGIEEGKRMTEKTMEGFSPDMSFAEGLKVQWENRAKFWIENTISAECVEVIRHSPHGEEVGKLITEDFRPKMEQFAKKAIAEKQLAPLPFEVYWSVAFGPLYSLIRFGKDGRSKGGRPFQFTNEIMYQTLDVFLKGLKP